MPRRLSAAFLGRVRALQSALDEVYQKTFDDWVQGFELDGNPERELLIWECMALAYRSFADGRTLSMDAKNEALDVTLQCSLGRTAEYLLKNERKFLIDSEILALVHSYRSAAEAIYAMNHR